MRGTVAGIIEGLNQVLVQFDDDFKLERGDVIVVDIPKEKRSLNANSYYWILNGKLAKALKTSGEAIYKHHIREMKIKPDCMMMLTEAVQGFEKKWTSKHLGRFIETRASVEEGKTIVLAYYGSSDFDKTEMSILIDNCIQDCKANGIVTYDQEEVNRMVKEWTG